MPSKKRRARKRRPIEWVPTLWVALACNVALGLLFSPLTKGQVVWVEGAPPSQREAIRQLVQVNRGIPGSRVNGAVLEGRVLELDPIATATYGQNLFGRGILKVTTKVGVASLKGTKGLLSEEGTAFVEMPDSGSKLPLLVLPPVFMTPTLSPLAKWESVRVAALCKEVARNLSERPLLVEVTERGVIQLSPVDGGAQVVLGSSDNWEKKVTTLRKMLVAQPDLWKRYSEVNLIDPDSPMTRP